MNIHHTPRLKLLGILILTTVSFLLLVSFNQQRDSDFPKTDHYVIPLEEFTRPNYTHVSIQEVISLQELLIREETSSHVFPGNKSLKDFTLASGGRPVRNVIITTWRSGSTFLGDILNAVPGTYYHYEPLLHYGIVQIRGPPFAKTAIRTLKSLLRCEYQELDNYLDYGQEHIYLFTHNVRLWMQCDLHPEYCWKAGFLNQFCRRFPFQTMKVVRLRLELAEELLKDESLNVNIVMLIRDPRGILQSRKHREWCPGVADCDEPDLLCSDMESDYRASKRFQKLYPNRFRVLRYEDLSFDPYKHVKNLFNFFGMHVHPNVIAFLDSHTKLNVGGVSSTYRDSKSAPFHWRTDLNFTEVQEIQRDCRRAMRMWGYAHAYNESHLHDFNPLNALNAFSYS